LLYPFIGRIGHISVTIQVSLFAKEGNKENIPEQLHISYEIISQNGTLDQEII
jgi:hypothetical protein